MKPVYNVFYHSPVGILEITGTEEGITGVRFTDSDSGKISPENTPECLENCRTQLDEYFRGERREFTIPLLLRGTEFQERVWNRVREVPFGETSAYGEITRSLDCPKSSRAVGHANGRNPIAIIIPCHRVVGGDGSLTGYAWGLWRKEWLLKHEQMYRSLPPFRG